MLHFRYSMNYFKNASVLLAIVFSLLIQTQMVAALTKTDGDAASVKWNITGTGVTSVLPLYDPWCAFGATTGNLSGSASVVTTGRAGQSCAVSLSACAGASCSGTVSDTLTVTQVYGACNNSTANACTAGTPIAITPDGAGSVWYCAGAPNDAAHRSPQCSWQPAAQPNCSFPAGSTWGTTNACYSGTSLNTPYGQSGTVYNTSPGYTTSSYITGTCGASGAWTGVGGVCDVVPLPPGGPTVTSLSFSPSTIAVGATSVVSFTSSNATACFGTAGSIWVGDLGGVSTPPSGISTPAMNTAGTYSQGIYCTGPGGTSPTVTANLTVGAVTLGGPCNFPPGYRVSWFGGVCVGVIAQSTAQGSQTTVNNTEVGYTGSATYMCDNTATMQIVGTPTCVPIAVGSNCPVTTVAWGACTGPTIASAVNGEMTVATDVNSYYVAGSYVGTALATCNSGTFSIHPASWCSQVICPNPTDASGSFAACSGICANGGTPYPSCPPPAFPDLVASNVTAGTFQMNTLVTLSGTITNNDNGSHTPTSGPFNNFMQLQSTSAIVGSVMNTPILAAGASRSISTTHTFTAVGTYFVRLCADKSSSGDLGLINEGTVGGENNNCSSYASITIVNCFNGATNNPTCNQCPAGFAWNTSTSACVPCDNGGCTGPGGNPTNPIGSLVCKNGANNPWQCNQCPANLAWKPSSPFPICAPCSNGGCTGTIGGSISSPVGNLVCNNKPTATPYACTYSQATPNPSYILDGASTCTSVLTFASDPNYVVSPYAMGPTGTIGSGGTAVIDYGTNNFPLGGYTPDYSGSASWGSLNVDGQCLVGSSFTVTTNTCISSGAPLPDLTAGPTDTTNFAIGQATVVTSQITNIGNDDVTIAFPTFFQIAAGPNGTGAIGGITGTTINSLVSAASKPTQRTFTFISSQSGSMRACANKSNASTFGPVLEADQTNNCGGWIDFTVTGCPVGTTWDTMNSACVNPQVIAYFITNNYYPPGSLNFSCTGSTDYTILDTTNNTVKVATTTYTTAVSWPVSTEAQYAVKCLSGNVADSKPLYYSVSPPPGSPKINLVITPRTITPNEKVTLTWDTIFPINTCSLTAKVVCANSACSAAQIVEQAKLTAVLVATTTDSNDPHGSSRNLQMAVRTVAPGHTTTDFKALGRKTLTIKYTTDFIYDCGSGRKETKRVQVTKNEER